MMHVVWTPKATKQLKKLGDKSVQASILLATRGLAEFPNTGNVKALVNHAHGFRLRVGHHRVLFDVLHAIQVVSIEEVRKRDERTY